jgi:hypothetical protein
MPHQPSIDGDLEINILQLWAQAMDIKLKFTPEQIQSVRGLSEAIEAAMSLPDEIGWGEEPPLHEPSGSSHT